MAKKNFIKTTIKSIIRFFFQRFSKTPLGYIRLLLTDEFTNILDPVYGKLWYNFLHSEGQIKALLEELTNGLDQESRQTVNLVFDRFVNMSETTKLNYVLVPNERFFTPNEIKEESEVKRHIKMWKKLYKLPGEYGYFPEVFYHHCGLKLLQNELGNDKVNNYLRDKVFIDGGGFIGDSILVFMEYQPAKIIVFEPDPENLKLLQKTISMNKIDRKSILISNYGLSDRKGEATLILEGAGSRVDPSLTKSSEAFSSFEKPKIRVQLIDLKSFLDEKRLEIGNGKIGLIKLDIEGAEYEAIKGSIEVIKKDRPVLLISIYHRPEDFFYIKPYLEKNLEGYVYLIRKLRPSHVVGDTLLLCYPKELEEEI